MKTRLRSLAKGIGPLLMLVGILAPHHLCASEWAGGKSSVVVRDGTMSLAIDDCPLGVLLEQIGSQSEVRFIVSESLKKDAISASFQALPFLEGLKRILIRKSYVMLFDRSSKLVEVLIIQKREGYRPPAIPFRPRYVPRTRLRHPRVNPSR